MLAGLTSSSSSGKKQNNIAPDEGFELLKKSGNGENNSNIYSEAWKSTNFSDVKFAGDAVNEETGEIPKTEQVEGNLNERLSEDQMPTTLEEWCAAIQLDLEYGGMKPANAAPEALEIVKLIAPDGQIGAEQQQQLIQKHTELSSRADLAQAEKAWDRDARGTTDYISSIDTIATIPNAAANTESPKSNETAQGEATRVISHFDSAESSKSGESYAERIAKTSNNTSEIPATENQSLDNTKRDEINMVNKGVSEKKNNAFAAAARADSTVNNAGSSSNTEKIDIVKAKAEIAAGSKTAAQGEAIEMQELAETSEAKLRGDGGVEQERNPTNPDDGSAPDQTDVNNFNTNVIGEAAAMKTVAEQGIVDALNGDMDSLAAAEEKIRTAQEHADTAAYESTRAGISPEDALLAQEANRETEKLVEDAKALMEENADKIEANTEDGADDTNDTEPIVGIFGNNLGEEISIEAIRAQMQGENGEMNSGDSDQEELKAA